MKMSSSNDSKPDNYQINAKICRLVERYPCMYDRSYPYYLKKEVVDKAWVKISKEMDDSIPSCKERWRNIRTSFARSINVNKIPASANRTKPYYLHEELQFLARHITPGVPVSRRSNASCHSAEEESEMVEVSVGGESFDGFAAMVQEEDSQDQKSSIDEASEAIKTDVQQQAQPLEKPQTAEPQPIVAENETVPTAQITPIYPPKKRQRPIEIDVITPEIEEDIKPSVECTNSDSDFDAVFLQGLLPEMKVMDFRQKLIFKRRVYEVIGDVFENVPHTSTNSSRISPPTATIIPTTTYIASNTPTMTMVNAADMAMIRRLNNLLQNQHSAASSSPVTAVPKSVASSTVRSCLAPANATVSVHRGALTRSTSNLMRVTMVNPGSTPTAQIVKLEPEVVDD